MNIGFIMLLILWIITIAILFIKRKSIEENLRKYLQQKLEQQLKEKNEQQIQSSLELGNQLNKKKEEIEQIESAIINRTETLKNLNQDIENYKTYIDKYVTDIKEEKIKALEIEMKQKEASMLQEAKENYNKQLENIAKAHQMAQDELNQITINLEAFRAKQESINKEILRQRELEEKQNFYRVCLSENDIFDINLLKTTRQNLKKPEIIDKIIYDNYIAKPVLEMIKRVLQNTTCSGIYKITCQKTKEIYIGKSTDIKNRWQQHCKTAFNCGTIASSILHRKMQQYGIENFTFELLEKVPKDQLSEREAFYIDFYQSKNGGLNERRG